MTEADRIKYLRIVLVTVGLVFIFGIYPLTIVWPSGWSWHTSQSMYLQMLLWNICDAWFFPYSRFAEAPLAHRSLDSVHCMVKRCARWNHGGPVRGVSGTRRTSLG